MFKFARFRSFPVPASAVLLGFGAAWAFAASAVGAPASAAPARCGLIWLDVDPGPAEVSLDGEYLDAGVWLISAPPGGHEIRVRKAGFRPYAARVEVVPGGEVRLDVRLEAWGGDP